MDQGTRDLDSVGDRIPVSFQIDTAYAARTILVVG